jgi:hypothetical protein
MMAEIPMPEAGAPPPTAVSERPTGVICITCLMVLGGVIDIFIGIIIPFYILLGIVNIVVGIFLYNLQPWAWTLAIILNIIFLILNIISVLGILSAMVNFIVLIYLNQPNVKAAFREGVSSIDEAW